MVIRHRGVSKVAETPGMPDRAVRARPPRTCVSRLDWGERTRPVATEGDQCVLGLRPAASLAGRSVSHTPRHRSAACHRRANQESSRRASSCRRARLDRRHGKSTAWASRRCVTFERCSARRVLMAETNSRLPTVLPRSNRTCPSSFARPWSREAHPRSRSAAERVRELCIPIRVDLRPGLVLLILNLPEMG